ncbi:probable isoprenylcysteine alpha-carbonyl methylesterase ICMEL2 isoform X2 [Rosa rugosa]|uniref:probable isoprenylcysteine alpha-carbonyl methylesterase ICMEL2 isoform X2 n=1 Tax=Rosa rugosa TaxID=74645 RepID=UPI002B413BA5|nr:probable isoprenylcysteine alpha-carbonyl methylesterase ICMEL2 isoform X2 [Rosa rugosa]
MFRTPISRFATLFRNPNPHKLLPTEPIPIFTKKARIFGPKQKLKMPSQQILPITYHPPSSNPATTEKLLVKSEEDPSTRLLLYSHFEDEEKAAPLKPLLPKSASYTFNTSTTAAAAAAGSANNNQKRRRRTASDNSLYSSSSNSSSEEGAADRQSIAGDVEHAAAETYLITRLSLKLLSYLGVGYRWITRFLALGCYSFLLMPGFIQVGYYYFFSKQVRRGIVYGDQPRNSYKAWGSLLGIQLSERDIIVACIDYRNFPQGTISDMVQDASQGISFVCNHIAEYGGDPDRVYVMGQSAGAHIGACSIVDQAIKELGEGESTSWSVSQIKAYFGLSGGYNLFNLVDHFHSRGLYRSIFLGIMEGEHSLQRFSPEVMIQDSNVRSAASLLPPIILFHGTADYSIPSDASKNFAETLRSLGVKAESILYEGKTHTDLFLQDPMRGGKDQMFEDLVAIIHEGDSEALAKDAVAPPRKRLVPEFMLKLAHKVSPF